MNLSLPNKLNHSFSLAKYTLLLQDEETISFLCRMKMWTVLIRDQTVHSVQSDLDLHCPQKLFEFVVISKKRVYRYPG